MNAHLIVPPGHNVSSRRLKRLIGETAWAIFLSINVAAVIALTAYVVVFMNTSAQGLSPHQLQERDDTWNHLVLGAIGVDALLFGAVHAVGRWSRRP